MTKDFSDYQVVRGSFDFDPDTTAVLVVDMLNDFCEPGGAMELPPGPTIRRSHRDVRPHR